VVPAIDPDLIAHHSERSVYVALRDQLDGRYLVLHSYPWLRLWRGDRTALLEGEADFVVAHPDKGILVLEVKGGEVYERRGEWHRRAGASGDKPIQNPFTQARRNMHALKEIIRENSADSSRRGLRGGRDYVHGYAVVFPHLHYRGPLPGYADRAIIISEPQLSAVQDAIEHAFDRWTDRELPMTPRAWGSLEAALLPRFAFYRPIGPELEAAAKQIHLLTEMQSQVYLQLLQGASRALVTGPAGSGKTILAVEQALLLAERGRRTLLLCYNRELATWIGERVDADPRGSAWSGSLTIRHFHGLARELADAAEVPFRPITSWSDAFWTDEAPDIMSQAIAVLGGDASASFDAVIVDEAQDFREEWWYPVVDLVCDEGVLQVFMDPNQSLWGEPKVPEIGLPAPLVLKANCRNTKRVARTSANILSIDAAPFGAAPEGIDPKIIRASSAGQQRGLVAGQVRTLLEDLGPSQLVLLGPASKENGSLASVDEIAGVRLVTAATEWRAGAGVLVTTARSFKGLEADAVIVYDLGRFGRLFTREDLYVASTRARFKLVFIVHDDALRGDLKGWAS